MNNVNILALDTSLDTCSVALQYQGVIQEFFSNSSKERSKKLLNTIEICLQTKKLEELHALAFAAGPGSLTGLKIASSVIQAISIVNNLPIIKVSTLEALALQAYEEFTDELKLNFKYIMPCIDAKMGQVYYGIYEIDHNDYNDTHNIHDNHDNNSNHANHATPHNHQKSYYDHNNYKKNNNSYKNRLKRIHPDSLSRWEEISLLLEQTNELKQSIYMNYIPNGILVVGDSSWLLKQKLPKSIICRLNIYDKLINYSAKNIIKIADYLYKNYDIISLSTDAIPLYIRSYN